MASRASSSTRTTSKEPAPPLKQFVDLGKERAVVGAITGEGLYNLIPEKKFIPVEAFTDELCRTLYAAARALQARGRMVCVESVNDELGRSGKSRQVNRLLDPGGNLLELWKSWPDRVDLSFAGCIAPRPVIYCLEELGALFQRRQGLRLAKAFEGGEIGLEEFASSVAAIHQHGQNGTEHALTTKSVPEIIAMEFAPDDILMANGYVAKGDSTIFCGAPGIGKSRLYLQMLLAFVTGAPFLGWDTHAMGTKWLVMQSENSNRRLNAELTAMCSQFTRPQMEMVSVGIRIHTLELPQDSFLSLSVPENEGAISEVIQAYQPTGIVFDVLRDFAIGDLNTDGDMTATLSALSRITRQGNPKRIPIVIHHALTGRSGAAKATGFDRGGFGRNSKVLTGWARAQINITAYQENSNETLVIASGKANNTEEFEPFGVTLDTETMTYHRDNSIDLEAWQERVGVELPAAAHPSVTIATVSKIVERAGLTGISKKLIARALNEEGASRATAYRLIEKSEAKKAIIRRKPDDLYVVPQPPISVLPDPPSDPF